MRIQLQAQCSFDRRISTVHALVFTTEKMMIDIGISFPIHAQHTSKYSVPSTRKVSTHHLPNTCSIQTTPSTQSTSGLVHITTMRTYFSSSSAHLMHICKYTQLHSLDNMNRTRTMHTYTCTTRTRGQHTSIAAPWSVLRIVSKFCRDRSVVHASHLASHIKTPSFFTAVKHRRQRTSRQRRHQRRRARECFPRSGHSNRHAHRRRCHTRATQFPSSPSVKSTTVKARLSRRGGSFHSKHNASRVGGSGRTDGLRDGSAATKVQVSVGYCLWWALSKTRRGGR